MPRKMSCKGESLSKSMTVIIVKKQNTEPDSSKTVIPGTNVDDENMIRRSRSDLQRRVKIRPVVKMFVARVVDQNTVSNTFARRP